MRTLAAVLVGLAVSCSSVPPSATPAPKALQARSGSEMAYDAVHKVTLLYDGWPVRGYPFFDTWTWNGAKWVQQQPAANPRLWSPGIAYDEARQRIVLFSTNVVTGGWVDGVPGDTWTWDGKNWRHEHPQTTPNARHSPHMVYDSRLNQVVMFGGQGFKSDTFADTWAWDGTNWHQLSGSIPGLTDGAVFGAAAYDAAIDRIVLYDHFTLSGPISAGMWLFDGSTWTHQSAGGSALPTDGFKMVYDAALQKLVLFGGELNLAPATATGRNLKSDIWLWDGHTWQLQPASPGPNARMSMGMSYDADRQQVLIFGGTDYVGGADVVLGDTWTWDGVKWTAGPTATPSVTAADVLAVANRIWFGPTGNPCSSSTIAQCPVTARLAKRIQEIERPLTIGPGPVAIWCRCPATGTAGSRLQDNAGYKARTAEVTQAGGIAHITFGTATRVDFIMIEQGGALLVDDTRCTGQDAYTSIYSNQLVGCG